jgi:hypothetical protein
MHREETRLARKLDTRIRGWRALDDALLNTRGDFNEAASFLANIGTDERSLGIWLETMITHPDLLRKLGENPQPPETILLPPLLSSTAPCPSHDEFIAFVKAYIGVASVMAVYAWADSVPNERCRERSLAILRLWQGTEGYRPVRLAVLLQQCSYLPVC